MKQALPPADMEHARIEHESVSNSKHATSQHNSKHTADTNSTRSTHDQDVVVSNDELNTVWIISESTRTNNFLKLELEKVGMSCTYMLITTDLQPKMSQILTKLKEE